MARHEDALDVGEDEGQIRTDSEGGYGHSMILVSSDVNSALISAMSAGSSYVRSWAESSLCVDL